MGVVQISVTMQQIADMVGVSRGTVDRAMHNRGRVNPEIAEKIAQTARELGYQTNMIGQALSRSKRDFKLGAILQSIETPTIQDILQSMKQADADLRSAGIELLLYEVQGVNANKVLKHIDSLVAEGVQGIAIMPIDDPAVVKRIDVLQEQGIPVVTLNSDISDSRRICFVGMDNYRAGQTAAWLMCQMLPSESKVFIVAGHPNNTAHINRLNGFLEVIAAERGKDIKLLPFQSCFDRDDYAHDATQRVLREHPDLSAIYVTSYGQGGVCQAIEEERCTGKIKVLAYDLNILNRRLLEEGKLSFVIDQGAFEQGYRPLQILSDFLLYNKVPEKQLLYTDISIRTKYNI